MGWRISACRLRGASAWTWEPPPAALRMCCCTAAPLALCAPGAWACALIKPQFEVGPAVAKGGVVRDPTVHRAVCERVAEWWNRLPGWRVLGVEPSPLLGP